MGNDYLLSGAQQFTVGISQMVTFVHSGALGLAGLTHAHK
jgi:hypothetical protein